MKHQASTVLYGVHLRTKIIENKRQFEVQKLDYPHRNLVILIWNRNERSRNSITRTWSYASVNSTCAQLPPGQLRGICPPCQSQGWGICKFCTARGQGICQPPAHFRAFDTHAGFYQNITTQKILLEKKQIDSSVKDRNKL